MVNIKEMINCKGKHINIKFTDGDIWENKYCTCFYSKQEDDEEHMLEFGNTVIYQSEIDSIEILD